MQDDLFARATLSSADIDGPYRYSLTRTWNHDIAAICCWVMLNPSTADETEDDATVRKCIAFSRSWSRASKNTSVLKPDLCWDFGGLVVVNLFAFRSTDPKALGATADPVGPRNDAVITAAAGRASLVVCAWGTHGTLQGRDAAVLSLLAPFNLHALHLTQGGHPGHPLYLLASTRPVPWSPRAR